ncbi:MAG: GNAT family N-acetyltransferase [Opitutaceae bacterium]
MSNIDFEVVRADLSKEVHRGALIQLMDTYARDIMGGGAALTEEVKRDLPNELSIRPTCHIVLAFHGNEPAGVSVNFEAFSTFACRPILNIHDFVVAPQFRGQGVAKLLLEEVEAIGRDLGCCKLTLEVLEGNSRAQSIYQRFGFDGYELDPEMGRALFYEKKLAE